MELINECSMRFAEDKDFRLLVCDALFDLARICDLAIDCRQYHGSLSDRLLWKRGTKREAAESMIQEPSTRMFQLT